MFNKTSSHTINDNMSVDMTFIKSRNIQVFPCGRRRSTPYMGIQNDDSRIPFDPEARLNTEANNRKHSGVNGFTQTYLDAWGDDQLSLALGGYLFNIIFDDEHKEFSAFAEAVATAASHIYANIQIERAQLFSGTYNKTVNTESSESLSYYTSVLGSWTSVDNKDDSALDLYASDTPSPSGSPILDNYYFSGLAFSSEPIATQYNNLEGYPTRDEYEHNATDENSNIISTKKIISMCILDKVDNEWKIHEPARLPKIEHGSDPNSVVMGDLEIKGKKDVEGNVINNGNLTVDNLIKTKELIADTATIRESTITETLTVHNGGLQATIASDNIKVPYINSSGTKIDDTTITKTGFYSPFARVAKIEALTGGISSQGDIKAPDLYQTVSGNDMKVPVIELDSLDTGFYQLKISRIGKKS